MKKEIDFLQAYEKKVKPGKDIFRFLTKGLILITIFYCVFLMEVFFYWSILNKNLQDINNKIELKKDEIKRLQKRESLYFLLKNQISFLSKIVLGNEENYSQIFSSIFQLAEGKVEVSEIKISSTGETKVSASAPTAFTLAKFLDEIAGSKDMEIFSKIILNSLSKQKEGGYDFSLTLSYDKN